MNAVTAETNIYSQHDAAAYAKACQTDLLKDIKIRLSEHGISLSATYTNKNTNAASEIDIQSEEDRQAVVIVSDKELWSHNGETMEIPGDDEATIHANKALAAAQAIYWAAAELHESVITDATAQLMTSFALHSASFSSDEGRKVTIEEQ